MFYGVLFTILDEWIIFLNEGMDEKTFHTVRNGLKKLADKAGSTNCR